MPPRDPYAFDGTLSMVLAIVTLQAGPWPFNILGFFIAALAAAPAILWALQGGWWPAILAASWLIFAAGRRWQVDVLPSQSERPFPILIWGRVVTGMVIGLHRRIQERLHSAARPLAWRSARSR